MGFCTQCGILLHDDDMASHICKEAEKPKKGKPKKASWIEQAQL